MRVRELAPGAVHVPGWLELGAQISLVESCRAWGKAPAGFHRTRLPSGHQMSVQTVCLGWHWYAYGYSERAEDGAPVKPFPEWLRDLGREGLLAAYGDFAVLNQYSPDVALVNLYEGAAKLGMHRDSDERSRAPVVSLSLGASCTFRFGGTERSAGWQDIELRSGDLFVFGGPTRLNYHGVVALGDPGPPELALAGRINVTLRESGLSHDRQLGLAL